MPRKYFHNINLLRAFAAISVVVYHVIMLFPWKDFPQNPFFLRWFITGWIGVDLFFIISGFVIMLSAFNLLDRYNLAEARRVFLIRRLFRIVPLYLLTCIFFLIFVKPELLKIPELSMHLWTHFLFIHNWFPQTHGSINGPNWSVATEMQFYMIVLIFMDFFSKMTPRKILISGIILALLTRFLVFSYATIHHWDPKKTFIYVTQVPTMADEFALGMFLAHLMRSSFYEKSLLFFANTFRRSLLLFGTFIVFWIPQVILWLVPYWTNTFMVVCWRLLMGLSLSLLLYCAVVLPPYKPPINPLYKSLFYLGEISYGIYLWHLPILLLLKKNYPEEPCSFLITLLGLVIFTSMISWELLEKPFIKKGKKMTT